MLSPSRIVWQLAGSPPAEGEKSVAGPCACCGEETGRGLPYLKWQGSNFMDQNRLRHPNGPMVCSACIWAHGWNPPPGHPLEPDKKRGPNLMMYSHLWSADTGYWYANKGNKAEMVRWLRTPRPCAWFAAIADSGQKHVLPYAPMVYPGGRPLVILQELVVELGNWVLYDDGQELLAAGASFEGLRTGAWQSFDFKKVGYDRLQTFERRWAGLRGSAWWELVMFLGSRPKKESNGT